MAKEVKSYRLDKVNSDWLTSQGLKMDGERSASWYLNDLLTRCRSKVESKKAVEKPVSKRFTPPTLDEAADYFKQRGFLDESEVEKFLDFYEMKGWMVGKNKMKDWKAAVRNWLKGKSNETNKPANAKSSRKLNAVEEANQRLLEKYGNNASHNERAINQPFDTGLDKHQVCGGIPTQVDSSGVTIDMDSRYIDYDSGADS